jgi:hypothetical protein
MADEEDIASPPVVDDSRLPMKQEDHPAHNVPTATDHHNGTNLGTEPYYGTMLSDSVIKTYQAFRKLGEPYRSQRDNSQ